METNCYFFWFHKNIINKNETFNRINLMIMIVIKALPEDRKTGRENGIENGN